MTRCNLCKLEHEPGECPARLIGKRILSIPPSAVAARKPKPKAAAPVIVMPEPTPVSSTKLTEIVPEGYTAGVVTRFEQARKLLIIKDDNRTWRAGPRDVDAPGQHYCLFQPGTHVFFRKGDESRAIDVRINIRFELPVEEVAVITYWNNTYGFCKRSCGCDLFVPGNSLVGKLPEVDAGTTIIYRLVDAGRSSRTADVDVVAAAA